MNAKDGNIFSCWYKQGEYKLEMYDYSEKYMEISLSIWTDSTPF